MDDIIFFEFKSRFLPIFDPKTMNIFNWFNSFDYVTEVLNIKGLSKSTFLLDNVQSSVLVEMMKHFCPRDPYSCPYEELINTLEIIYGKPCSKQDGAYYRFLLRDQLPYEPAQHYFTTLGDLLSQSFPIVYTSENLMFRFIEGLSDKEIRTLLLNHPGFLTLSEAINIAKQKEIEKKKITVPLMKK